MLEVMRSALFVSCGDVSGVNGICPVWLFRSIGLGAPIGNIVGILVGCREGAAMLAAYVGGAG